MLAIETYALSKEFGKITAVKDLSLAVPRGAIFGFLGPNGAGKTTTIRLLLGLVRPSSGTVRILGHDIQHERAAILPRVGAIIESPAFYMHLSARDNLEVLSLTSGKRNRARIDELLKLVHLEDRANDALRTFSLGMKQRLAVAAALIHNPDLLFLDEPTNGLDPAGTVEMRDLIRSLGAAGQTIFLSSHQLYEVEQLCDQIAIIHQGQLVAQGNVAEMLLHDTGTLIEVEPLPLAQAVIKRMGLSASQVGPRMLSVNISPDKAPRVVNALVSAGVSLYQVRPERQSLEQRFLELTELRAPRPEAVVAELLQPAADWRP